MLGKADSVRVRSDALAVELALALQDGGDVVEGALVEAGEHGGAAVGEAGVDVPDDVALGADVVAVAVVVVLLLVALSVLVDGVHLERVPVSGVRAGVGRLEEHRVVLLLVRVLEGAVAPFANRRQLWRQKCQPS